MGIFKDTRASTIGAEAHRAYEEGRTVFVPLMNTPATASGMSGSISGWAEMIEAVEQAGWVLTEWSVAHDSKGRPEAYPLFRSRR